MFQKEFRTSKTHFSRCHRNSWLAFLFRTKKKVYHQVQFARTTSRGQGLVWSIEQPCLARCAADGVHNCFMIHVEDLLFTGSSKFWVETFLPAMTSKFNVGHNELKNDGTEISFLKRRLVKSSAESELHSMVSGCSDAIFIRRCLEFLSCSMVTHQQWTDNSAAQMLVSRQGVGRIRHLSRKWIQTLVLQQEVSVGQVPTGWNYSDIGT